jgi:hypothetical protein
MKKHFWKEKYINEDWSVYFGTIRDFRIGITFGLINEICLGWWIIGISKF